MSGDRSSERIAAKKMTTTEELKEYFKHLIVPLATTVSIEEMFQSFSSEVVAKLEKRLDDQEVIIKAQTAKLEEMESRLSLSK